MKTFLTGKMLVVTLGLALFVYEFVIGLDAYLQLSDMNNGMDNLYGIALYDESYMNVLRYSFILYGVAGAIMVYKYFTLDKDFPTILVRFACAFVGVSVIQTVFLYNTPLYELSQDGFYQELGAKIFDIVVSSIVAVFWTWFFREGTDIREAFEDD